MISVTRTGAAGQGLITPLIDLSLAIAGGACRGVPSRQSGAGRTGSPRCSLSTCRGPVARGRPACEQSNHDDTLASPRRAGARRCRSSKRSGAGSARTPHSPSRVPRAAQSRATEVGERCSRGAPRRRGGRSPLRIGWSQLQRRDVGCPPRMPSRSWISNLTQVRGTGRRGSGWVFREPNAGLVVRPPSSQRGLLVAVISRKVPGPPMSRTSRPASASQRMISSSSKARTLKVSSCRRWKWR